jgi:hypothetical protein
MGVDGLDDGQKAHVKAQHRIFGVIDDPGDLLRMQARIERVQNPARTADAEIQLKVAVAIPGQGGHAVAEAQLQRIQRVGDLARATSNVLVGVAVQIALDAAGNHLALAVVAFGKLDERRNEQRMVLHQTQHGNNSLNECL